MLEYEKEKGIKLSTGKANIQSNLKYANVSKRLKQIETKKLELLVLGSQEVRN